MAKVSDFRKLAQDAPPDPPERRQIETGDEPFDPREFRVPITTKGKPPDIAHFKLQMAHTHEIARIVAAKMFPHYETSSDVYRHATERHVKWLHRLGAPVTAEWLQTEAIMELMREEQHHQDFANNIDKLQTCVDKSVDMGMKSEARLLVHKIRLLVAQMSDGRWKERWEQEIAERFGFLDRPSPTVEA